VPIVQTADGLKTLTTPQPFSPTSSYGSSDLNLFGRAQTYAAIYASQPNVRTCVDFLARNVAQLGIHVFRRVSDTDRVRLVDHDVARWLTKPNPSTTRYRLIEALMGDLGIYFRAYWLKVRDAYGDMAGFVRLPPEEMFAVGGLLPSSFVWLRGSDRVEFAPEDVATFGGYNPINPLMGLSPLETLRQVLAEEAAASENRESYWRNASRMEGVIEQTKDAPNYTETQQQAWRTQWQEYAGGGAKAGMTALLPKGMTIKPWSFSAFEVFSLWSMSALRSPSKVPVVTFNTTPSLTTVADLGYPPVAGASPERSPLTIPQPGVGTNCTPPSNSITSPALTGSS